MGRKQFSRAALAGALLAAALIAPAAHAAESISIDVGADPTEEVPLTIAASWSSGESDPSVFVTVKPAGGRGCGDSYAADEDHGSTVLYDTYTDPSGTLSDNWTFQDPAEYTLCGYLQRHSDDTSPLAATGPVAVQVRSARATVSLAVPARVDPGQTFSFSVPVVTELARQVYVTMKPAGGRACEPTYALDDPISEDLMYGADVQGEQSPSSTEVAPSTQATYLLCAYVQEHSTDTAAEAVASAQMLVGPDPCVSARTALTAAERAVRVAERSTTRTRKAWKRYKRLARRAGGATRKRYRALAKRSKSRYRSAIRRRAKARGDLATQQAAVTQACG